MNLEIPCACSGSASVIFRPLTLSVAGSRSHSTGTHAPEVLCLLEVTLQQQNWLGSFMPPSASFVFLSLNRSMGKLRRGILTTPGLMLTPISSQIVQHIKATTVKYTATLAVPMLSGSDRNAVAWIPRSISIPLCPISLAVPRASCYCLQLGQVDAHGLLHE